MCSIEEAANSIAFACKKYYVQVLLKELSLLNTTSKTYHLALFNFDAALFYDALFSCCSTSCCCPI